MAAPLAPLVIGRARLPAAPGRDRAARAALTRSLAPLGQRGSLAAGESPAAILLVRRLQVEDPGPRGGLSGQVRDRLRTIRNRAARPAGGRVPEAAEAVLFADEAELLACLAAAPEPSWWRRAASRLLGDVSGPGGLSVALAGRAESLPAVVALLDLWGAAPAAVRVFSPGEAGRMARALAAAWEVPIPEGSDRTTATDEVADRVAGRAGPSGRTRPPDAARADPAEALFAAARLLACGRPMAPAERDRIAGLIARAAGIAAAPANGTGGAPVSVLSRVRRPGLTPSTESGPGVRPGDPASGQMDAVPTLRAVRAAAVIVPDAADAADPLPAERRTGRPDGRRPGTALPDAPGPGPSGPASCPPEKVPRGPAAPTPAAPQPGPDRQDAAMAAARRAEALPRTESFRTDLGGLFFLWTLARALGLPGAAADWDMETALGPWALIAGLGRALLPAREARPDDPAWTLLDTLDGTPDETPAGTGMRVPDTIRVPRTWLTGGIRRLNWTHAGGHLTLRTATGIAVLRQPCAAADLPAALAEAIGACPGALATAGRTARPPRARAAPGLDPAFRTWLDWMTPAIRARLAAGLSCRTAAAHRVLIRPATIHRTPARLDVVFALDQADLATRRAGLDIDPGWVPALGHILRFHYV